MTFYWSLWAFFFILSLFWNNKNYTQNYKILALVIIILALITGGREYVGADWETYKSFYLTGIADDKSSGKTELLFQLLRDVSYYIGLSYGMFCSIVALLSLSILIKALKLFEIKNCYIGFLVYLSLFFCNYQFNIIRHGVMASFILLGVAYLSKGDKRKALISVTVGCGFHLTGLIFIPLFFIIGKAFSRKWCLIVVALSFVFFITDLSGKIMAAFPFLALIDRVSGYVDTDQEESYKLSIGTIGFLLIAVYTILFRKKDYYNNIGLRIATNMVLISFIVFCSLNAFSAIVQRLGNLFNLGVIVVIPYYWQNTWKLSSKIVVRSLIIAYLALYYPKTWNVPNEKGEYSMLPFKTDITNLF